MDSFPQTPPEHEHSARIDLAARFLALTPPHARPTPLVPALKAMFDLTSSEAAEAIAESHLIRARAI